MKSNISVSFLILATLISAFVFVPYSNAEDWYLKPAYPDYAPNGMPDFDQKQDAWGLQGPVYTWCGPVAAANSLWWLDSEFESVNYPTPIPPSNISDHFGLVTAYGQWDDHHVQNVDPLVNNLAFLMDTDDKQPPFDGHVGTRWQDMMVGISQYLIQQGVSDQFEVHHAEFPDFPWIEYEIERCQDVVLLLEFWQFLGDWYPITYPSFESGHYVTCAGVNSSTFELLISDPWWDAAEAGFPGQVLPPGHPAMHPWLHNDTLYVSHDSYSVALWQSPPNPPSPYGPAHVWELVNYLQQLQYPPWWHAFIRVAVVTSPIEIPPPTQSVGGTYASTNKFLLLSPYVGSALAMLAGVAVTSVGLRRFKRDRNRR